MLIDVVTSVSASTQMSYRTVSVTTVLSVGESVRSGTLVSKLVTSSPRVRLTAVMVMSVGPTLDSS